MEGLVNNEEGTRLPSVQPDTSIEKKNDGDTEKNLTFKGAAAQNFDKILQLAGGVIEIRKMKTASKAVLAKMAEDRKLLLAEAEAYAQKKQADTSSVVAKMTLIRNMMQDFYANNNGSISGDEFCKMITEIVNQMGRVENGL